MKVLCAFMLVAVLGTTGAQADHRRFRPHRDMYWGLDRTCLEAWRVRGVDEAGPSGICVPPEVRPPMVILGPMGNTNSRQFFDDLDRWKGGGSVD